MLHPPLPPLSPEFFPLPLILPLILHSLNHLEISPSPRIFDFYVATPAGQAMEVMCECLMVPHQHHFCCFGFYFSVWLLLMSDFSLSMLTIIVSNHIPVVWYIQLCLSNMFSYIFYFVIELLWKALIIFHNIVDSMIFYQRWMFWIERTVLRLGSYWYP